MSQDDTRKEPERATGPQGDEGRSPAGAWRTMGQAEPVNRVPDPAPAVNVHDAVTPADAPTIGTGTSIALGCVAGTILLIVVGLIYIAIAALL